MKLLPFALALLSPFAACLAQAPQPRGPEQPVMIAAEGYLFVLRRGVIYQFDADTLELLRRARLPDAPPATAEIVEEVEETEVEEGPEAAEPSAERPAFAGRRGGRRVLAARGANKTARAIELGLEWLKAHQDDDGKWDADRFMKHDLEGAPSDGPGNPAHDVAVTGLALLAFLGDGSTMRSGPYRDVIRSGVRWLTQRQDAASGLIGSGATHDFIYDHAVATLALCEAYGLSDYELLRKYAQRAVDYLERHRNPYMVWRYQPRDNDNDTSVTTWCLMACRSARDFGLEVNPQAFALVAAWYDQVTDPTSGRAGYTKRGEPSSRHPGDHATRFPPERTEALTAAALFGRFLLGQNPDRSPVMSRAADTVLAKPPSWNEPEGTIDHYYWFFGSYALYQYGGRHWSEWSRHLTTAVVKTQRADGNHAGSWDPAGVWGEDGGRVYSTAMMTLALEAYYRYARVLGGGGPTHRRDK